MTESRSNLSVVPESESGHEAPLEDGFKGRNALVRFASRNRNWISAVLMAAAMAYGTSVFWKNLWRNALPEESVGGVPSAAAPREGCALDGGSGVAKQKKIVLAQEEDKIDRSNDITPWDPKQRKAKGKTKTKEPVKNGKAGKYLNKGGMSELQIDECINNWKCYAV